MKPIKSRSESSGIIAIFCLLVGAWVANGCASLDARMERIQDKRTLSRLQALDFQNAQTITVGRLAQGDSASAKSGFGADVDKFTRDLPKVGQGARMDFPGRRLASQWRQLTEAESAGFVEELRRPLTAEIAVYAKIVATKLSKGEEFVRLSGLCRPSPGYAVWLETDRGRRFFAVCLECGWMEIQDESGHKEELWFSDDEPLLASLKARYDSQFAAKK